MLMSVQESVDYNYVADRHTAIHARLENWRRWVTVRPHGWQTHPMWRNSRSSRQWEESPHISVSVDTIDALLIEKAVGGLPWKHRDALRWYYVRKGNPAAMAQQLALSKQGLADIVLAARTMLINTVKR